MKNRTYRAFTLGIFLSLAVFLGVYFVNTAAGDSKSAGEAKSDDTEQNSESKSADSDETKADDKKDAVPVRTTSVETGRVASYISATANLVPENEIKLLAEWEGRIGALEVDEGDRVRAGQVIATVAREDGEIAYNKAQVRASASNMSFERAKKLRDQELISSDEFDKFSLDKELADQELAEAEWRLGKTSVLVPWSGMVTERIVAPGQHVRPGDELFALADFHPLVARIYLPEKDVLALDEGRKVRLALKADEAVAFVGRIRQISPMVDTATGTVKVTVEVTQVPKAVRPGAFVDVHIVREARQEALLLPREAVVRELQKAYVFVAEDGSASKRAVTLGLEEDGRVEVTSGVAIEDSVIVAGQGGLKDGSAVTVVVGP